MNMNKKYFLDLSVRLEEVIKIIIVGNLNAFVKLLSLICIYIIWIK